MYCFFFSELGGDFDGEKIFERFTDSWGVERLLNSVKLNFKFPSLTKASNILTTKLGVIF